MPTYEYECDKCGNRFDVFQSMTSKPGASCPKCKGKASRLLGTGSGIIFKGTGFYETDYKTKKGTPDTEKKPSCGGGDSGACKNCPAKDK